MFFNKTQFAYTSCRGYEKIEGHISTTSLRISFRNNLLEQCFLSGF